MAHAVAGVLRLGNRDAAHVPHDVHREPQPALTGQRQLGLPLFLLLMSLAVPLILWAGLKLGATTNPEYFTLGVGIAANSKSLALLAYVGGLSAASGLIIVTTSRFRAWRSITWCYRFTSRRLKAIFTAG